MYASVSTTLVIGSSTLHMILEPDKVGAEINSA